MSEMKLCPFCGSEPTSQRGASSYNPGACCYTKGCVLEARWFPIDDWNNRPIEDALNARIAELESLVEQLIWVGNDLLVSNTNPVTITLFNGLVCNAKERER